MKELIGKLKLIFKWIKNSKKIIFFREFFIFYIQKIIDLNQLPKEKKYLTSFVHGIVSGYCPREFMFYAPEFMGKYINEIAEKVFFEKESQDLYKLVFLRNMFSSHFITGWEKYYDDENTYLQKLAKIKSEIKNPVVFRGNLFTLKRRNAGNFSLNLLNGISYILPINWFEISVFSFKIGLIYLEVKYLNYIKNKDIIDIGAFVGDSSVVLSGYTDKKVLAIEPEKNNYKLLQETIILNKLQGKVEPLNIAIDKKKGRVGIFNHGAGSRMIESLDDGMATITLDELVSDKKYKNIGLIKMDVEGFEMNVLLGCDKTIMENKPILLVSIYHNGEQFIKIPLYLKEKYHDIYDFRFVDCNILHPLSEKVLVCLPKNV